MPEVIVIALLIVGFFWLVSRTPKGSQPRDANSRGPNPYSPKLQKPIPRRSKYQENNGTAPDRSNWSGAPPPIPMSLEISGKCYVIDGDTIVIKRTKIGLAGTDAPELHQTFGQKSKWAMVNICKGKVVTAKLSGETSHDRLVATCYLPDGRDIGAELIKLGLAADWGFFSGGKYRHLEPAGSRRKLRRPPFDW